MGDALKRLFAIDLGASGGKCFAGTFGPDGFAMEEIHRFAHESVSFFQAGADGADAERMFWDDIAIYRHIVEGLHAYRREVSDRLDSIGIDTWGADGQLVTADGDMLGRVYAYRDHRLDTMVDAVKARLDPARIYAITGIHFQPFNLSNQLLWLVLNRPALIEQAASFLPVPSLFYYYLGGVKIVDSSWASVSQLMDAATREWSGEMLRALGIPARLMPAIVAPGARVGALRPALAERVGLNAAPLIASAGHDTAAAFAAAPVKDPARALIISSGTWALVGKLVDRPFTTPEALAANLSNEGGIGNVRLLKNCMGGWLVQELRRGWRLRDGAELSWGEMEALTEAAPGFTAFINPNDLSFYNPADMEQAILEFCTRTGQPVPSDRGTMMRVIYESLALLYRQINEQICAVTGTQTDVVHVVGGGCRNGLLNQCIADALGLPVTAGPEDATAVGNIMVQALGTGLIESLPAAIPLIRGAFPITDRRPAPKADWDAAYARFQAICIPG